MHHLSQPHTPAGALGSLQLTDAEFEAHKEPTQGHPLVAARLGLVLLDPKHKNMPLEIQGFTSLMSLQPQKGNNNVQKVKQLAQSHRASGCGARVLAQATWAYS